MKRNMTMLAAAALLAGSLVSTASTPADAAIKTIGECYTAVTNACNKKKSDQAVAACNKNGHNQCDKQFGSSKMETGDADRLRPGSALKSDG